MNLAETSDLLTLIAQYDNRRVDDATVIAWQAVLADLDPDDCQTAVMRHTATSDAYLKPFHIRQHVKTIRDERTKATTPPIALPGRYEPDLARDTRIERGAATVREVLQPILRELERRRYETQPAPTPEDDTRQRALDRARRERREWTKR